jgi:hypothetical protein
MSIRNAIKSCWGIESGGELLRADSTPKSGWWLVVAGVGGTLTLALSQRARGKTRGGCTFTPALSLGSPTSGPRLLTPVPRLPAGLIVPQAARQRGDDVVAEGGRPKDVGVRAEGLDPRGKFFEAGELELSEEGAVGLEGEALGGVVGAFADEAGDGGGEADADGLRLAVALEDAQRVREEVGGAKVRGPLELELLHFGCGDAIDLDRAEGGVVGRVSDQIQGVLVPDEGVGMHVVVRHRLRGPQRLVGNDRQPAVLDRPHQFVEQLALPRVVRPAVRLLIEGRRQLFQVPQRRIAQGRTDLAEGLVGAREEIRPGQRLQKLPA